MNREALERTARQVAAANLTPLVARVRLIWEEQASKLSVQYFVDEAGGDEELEMCELTVAELVAEFPEIRLAASQCLPVSSGVAAGSDGVVYLRP